MHHAHHAVHELNVVATKLVDERLSASHPVHGAILVDRLQLRHGHVDWTRFSARQMGAGGKFLYV